MTVTIEGQQRTMDLFRERLGPLVGGRGITQSADDENRRRTNGVDGSGRELGRDRPVGTRDVAPVDVLAEGRPVGRACRGLLRIRLNVGAESGAVDVVDRRVRLDQVVVAAVALPTVD